MDFLTIKSLYLYAKNSYETRQEDRYTEAIDEYSRFVEKYPKSAYIKEAEKLKDDSLKGIENAKKILALSLEYKKAQNDTKQ